jgi:hypothetical protein
VKWTYSEFRLQHGFYEYAGEYMPLSDISACETDLAA